MKSFQKGCAALLFCAFIVLGLAETELEETFSYQPIFSDDKVTPQSGKLAGDNDDCSKLGADKAARGPNGHCYLFFPSVREYSQSRRKCEAVGGHIVTITDNKEANFVAGTFQKFFDGKGPWLGLVRISAKAPWMTVTSEVSIVGNDKVYGNWKDGEPSKAKSKMCSALSGNDETEWASESCKSKRSTLCEVENLPHSGGASGGGEGDTSPVPDIKSTSPEVQQKKAEIVDQVEKMEKHLIEKIAKLKESIDKLKNGYDELSPNVMSAQKKAKDDASDEKKELDRATKDVIKNDPSSMLVGLEDSIDDRYRSAYSTFQGIKGHKDEMEDISGRIVRLFEMVSEHNGEQEVENSKFSGRLAEMQKRLDNAQADVNKKISNAKKNNDDAKSRMPNYIQFAEDMSRLEADTRSLYVKAKGQVVQTAGGERQQLTKDIVSIRSGYMRIKQFKNTLRQANQKAFDDDRGMECSCVRRDVSEMQDWSPGPDMLADGWNGEGSDGGVGNHNSTVESSLPEPDKSAVVDDDDDEEEKPVAEAKLDTDAEAAADRVAQEVQDDDVGSSAPASEAAPSTPDSTEPVTNTPQNTTAAPTADAAAPNANPTEEDKAKANEQAARDAQAAVEAHIEAQAANATAAANETDAAGNPTEAAADAKLESAVMGGSQELLEEYEYEELLSGNATDMSNGTAGSDDLEDGWNIATLANGWKEYHFKHNKPGYYKDLQGITYLRGLAKGGTVGSYDDGGIMFVIPEEYAPMKTATFDTISGNKPARIEVQTDGSVVAVEGVNEWFSLDGISFCSASLAAESTSPSVKLVNFLLDNWAMGPPKYERPMYFKDRAGFVHLQGLIKGGGFMNPQTGNGGEMFKLETDFKPVKTYIFKATSTSGIARIDVSPEGNVVAVKGGDMVSLDGLSYRVRQDSDEWTSPNLQNNWKPYNADNNPPGFFKDQFRMVHLRGVVQGGEVNGTKGVIFTLPEGYRPLRREIQDSISGDEFGRVDVEQDGTVIAMIGKGYVSLDGLVFRAKEGSGRPPGSPRQPKVNGVTDSSAKVSWDKPASPGSDGIKKYSVLLSDDDAATWSSIGDVEEGKSRVFDMKNLKSEQAYVVKVRATSPSSRVGPSSQITKFNTLPKSSDLAAGNATKVRSDEDEDEDDGDSGKEVEPSPGLDDDLGLGPTNSTVEPTPTTTPPKAEIPEVPVVPAPTTKPSPSDVKADAVPPPKYTGADPQKKVAMLCRCYGKVKQCATGDCGKVETKVNLMV